MQRITLQRTEKRITRTKNRDHRGSKLQRIEIAAILDCRRSILQRITATEERDYRGSKKLYKIEGRDYTGLRIDLTENEKKI